MSEQETMRIPRGRKQRESAAAQEGESAGEGSEMNPTE